ADRHYHQCGIADGCDHVGGHFGIQLHPGGELRQRDPGPPESLGAGGRDRIRAYAPQTHSDDRHGDDPGHDPNGAGSGRGGRTESTPGPRRDRRPAAGHHRYPVSGAHRLYSSAPKAAVALHPRQALRGRDARLERPCLREFDPMTETGSGGFRRAAILVVVLAAIIAVVVIVWRHMNLSSQRNDLADATSKGPVVQVVKANAAAGLQNVTVLASVTPYSQATLYAKVSGYLSKVLVDKGDHVKTGQLLATIESQETDAQYNSAQADLINKQRIAQRYDQLLRQNAIAAQQADQADADARIAKATLDQDGTLKSYERLIAPFDGQVTARFVHEGDEAQIVDAANTGRSVTAKITRVSGQLDPRTRTMLVEVVLDNKDNFLL